MSMNTTPEERGPEASRGIRQAYPERVSLAESAAPVRGEPVEPPPHAPSPDQGEPVESPATTFERLHPAARWGMRLTTTLLLAGPSVIPSAVLLLAWDAPSGSLRLALWIVVVAGALIAGWALGNLRYARTGFALDDAGLRIRRGLWWRSETLVPRSRVQHTDINHGPLDRRLGLATLRVYTAGTRLASVALDGLPEARAIALRDALVAKDRDVV